MGNQLGCFGGGQLARPKQKKKQVVTRGGGGGLRKRGDWENGMIEQQALAMALQQQHKAQLRFERSVMNRDPPIASFQPPRKSYAGRTLSAENKPEFKRSNSSRFRRLDDLLVDPGQLIIGSKVFHILSFQNHPISFQITCIGIKCPIRRAFVRSCSNEVVIP